MKNNLLLFLLMFIWQNNFAQNFYETSWNSSNVKYTALLIYYDDDDAIMRVNYKINDKLKVAEFKCYVQHFEEDDIEGYLLDGRDAKVVYGYDGTGYSADNFIFVKNGNSYSTPIHIDDQSLKKGSIETSLLEVEYWKELSTNSFSESYISKFFAKDEPLYNTLLSFNLQNNQASGSATQFRITSFSYGKGEWAVAMSQNSGYAAQSWNTSSEFPKDWIREKWADNFYITTIANGGGEWAVAMSKGVKFTTQSWKLESSFPQDWIQEKWNENFRITSLAYGGGEWSVVVSKNSGYSMQSWKRSSTFPLEWIKEKWSDNYMITSVAYGDEEWVVVMSQNSGYVQQSWTTNTTYPKGWIKEKWDEGYQISSIGFGGGLWSVIMSKGTGFLMQSWKTSANYPKDWIREKWDGGISVENEQPVQVENSTLHLILVTNTLISDIGMSCQVDKNNSLNEFEIICGELDIPFKKSVISDREFSKSNLTNTLNNLNPSPNDIVIFIYSGHGFRWSNQNSEYPNLDLRYSNFQEISANTSFNLHEVYNSIIAKGARLNIVLGDCCNSDIGLSYRAGEPSLASRAQYKGKVDYLRRLFLESRGNLLAAAARRNETSCGNSRDGGYFLSSFFTAIYKETSHLNNFAPQWANIISNTIKTANYKTLNLEGCTPQNGIYKSTIK